MTICKYYQHVIDQNSKELINAIQIELLRRVSTNKEALKTYQEIRKKTLEELNDEIEEARGHDENWLRGLVINTLFFESALQNLPAVLRLLLDNEDTSQLISEVDFDDTLDGTIGANNRESVDVLYFHERTRNFITQEIFIDALRYAAENNLVNHFQQLLTLHDEAQGRIVNQEIVIDLFVDATATDHQEIVHELFNNELTRNAFNIDNIFEIISHAYNSGNQAPSMEN